jgi:flagellin-like protein
MTNKNDEAVSPVIGVILMVAITVFLAALIAVFWFGYASPAPLPVCCNGACTITYPTPVPAPIENSCCCKDVSIHTKTSKLIRQPSSGLGFLYVLVDTDGVQYGYRGLVERFDQYTCKNNVTFNYQYHVSKIWFEGGGEYSIPIIIDVSGGDCQQCQCNPCGCC